MTPARVVDTRTVDTICRMQRKVDELVAAAEALKRMLEDLDAQEDDGDEH